jgi:protein CpxP
MLWTHGPRKMHTCARHMFHSLKGFEMNKTFKHLLIGATMSVMALGAVAHEGAAPNGDQAGRHHMSGDGHHKRMDPAKFKENMAKRQAELRQKLNLTPAQEPAWNAFTAAMTPPDLGKRPDRAEMEKLTAPEHMERKLQRMQQMQTRMSKQLEAVKAFYAQLTPEQRATFDQSMKRGRHHKRG